MTDKIANIIQNLGANGIDAFYVYLFLEYGSMWVVTGLCVWGIQAMWKFFKEGGL